MSLVGLVDLGGGLNLGGNPAVCLADPYSYAGLTVGVPQPLCGAGAGTPCGCGCSGGTAAALDAGDLDGGCSNNGSSLQNGSGGTSLLFLDLSALAGARPLPGYICPLPPTVAAQQAPVSPLPGIAPIPVPGSGSSFSQGVLSKDINNIPVSGLLIRCTETGVTLGSVCSHITFYTNSNATQHYTSLQGPGTGCNSHVTQTYGAGTGGGTPPNNVEISVSVV